MWAAVREAVACRFQGAILPGWISAFMGRLESKPVRKDEASALHGWSCMLAGSDRKGLHTLSGRNTHPTPDSQC